MSNPTEKEIRYNDINKLLFVLLCTPTLLAGPRNHECAFGLPVLIVGPPGIGKSANAKQVSHWTNLFFQDVNSAGIEPADVNGVLEVNDGRVRRLPALPELDRLIEMGQGLLLFEELGTAPAMVQAACRMSILERRFGSVRVPRRARFMATTNDPKHGGVGFPLEPQLANRFAHIFLPDPSAKEVGKYFSNQLTGKDDERRSLMCKIDEAEDLIENSWSAVGPGIVRLVSAFLESTAATGLLRNQPTDATLASRPFPTPRSWEMATRALITASILGEYTTLVDDILLCTVGPAAMEAFSAYVTALNLPTIDDLLADKWSFNPYALDQAFLALASLAAHIKDATAKGQRVDGDAVWRVIVKIDKSENLDLAIPTVAAALNIPGYSYKSSRMSQEATQIIRRMSSAGYVQPTGRLN